MRKVVLFDLDGTLIDSAIIIVGIINAIRRDRAYAPLAVENIRPHLSKGGRALVAASLGEAAREQDADLALFRSLYADVDQDRSVLYNHVEATLAALAKAGFALAVCTNKPAHLAKQALAAAGVAHHFEEVVAAGEGMASKPDPAMLLEACHRLGVTPEASLLIGDSEADAEAARQIGMPFVFASYGYPVGDPADIKRSYTISCMSELPDIARAALAPLIHGEAA